jgi:hypothetical protein
MSEAFERFSCKVINDFAYQTYYLVTICYTKTYFFYLGILYIPFSIILIIIVNLIFKKIYTANKKDKILYFNAT